ncbi:MAG: sugar ABC transporter permease [Trueperaceae bacterium]|nr:sugar ABC transporter permease [Trueperaceae bacterium]
MTRPGPVARMARWRPRTWAPYLFLLPFFAFFAIFWIYPIAASFVLSFLNTRQRPWTLDWDFNWGRLLQDEFFWNALQNTLTILVVQVPIMLAFATLLAVAFASDLLRAKGFFRFAFFAPLVLGAVPYSAVFRLVFNEQFGVLNFALSRLGLPTVSWLFESTPAMITIMIALTWRWAGYNAIILLSGLQAIPQTLYEAARIDGAGPIQQFFRITLPLLRPVLLFCFVLSTIGTLQLFTEPWLITTTGPGNATETLVTYLYKQGFRSFNFGYASAIAYTVALIAAIFSLIQIRVVGSREVER